MYSQREDEKKRSVPLLDLKEKIKDTPISSIIGHYISLTRKGSYCLALCPFHNDTNPSLTVNDSKGMFICFACQTGGDAITFVEKYKRLDFKETLKEIAKLLGLPYEEYGRSRKVPPKTSLARWLFSQAMQLYCKLAEEGPHHSIFESFLQRRGLSRQTAKTFHLGLAPPDNALVAFLSQAPQGHHRHLAPTSPPPAGKSPQDIWAMAKELGLIRESRSGGRPYDTFQSRIIFPIWDHSGHVVGLGGRATQEQQLAKYLNSQESFHFNKKNVCYGFHLAKSFIRERDSVILVEGYMDMISLYQKGLENTIAVMGVGMSGHTLRSLKSLTQNLYLGLDTDTAGSKAKARINELCLKGGIIPLDLDFSPHKDPDEFISERGPLAFAKLMEQAPPFIDVLLAQALPEKIPSLTDRKLAILHQMFALLAPIGTTLSATERLVKMGKRLGLKSGPDQIISAYKAAHKDYENSLKHPSSLAKHPPPLPPPTKVLLPDSDSDPDPTPTPTPPTLALGQAERLALREITLHPSLLTHENALKLLDFLGHDEIKLYFSKLRNIIYEIDEREYPEFVLSTLNEGTFSLELREVVGNALYKYRPMPLDEKKKGQLMTDLEKTLQIGQLKIRKMQLKLDRTKCHTEEEVASNIKEVIHVERQLEAIKRNRTATQ